MAILLWKYFNFDRFLVSGILLSEVDCVTVYETIAVKCVIICHLLDTSMHVDCGPQ